MFYNSDYSEPQCQYNGQSYCLPDSRYNYPNNIKNMYSNFHGALGKPNRPLDISLFLYDGKNLNERQIIMTLWESFTGSSWTANQMFLKDIIAQGDEILKFFPIMDAKEAERKFGLNAQGNRVIFDEWHFKVNTLAPKSNKLPGQINTSTRNSESQILTTFGNGFDVPMDWILDPIKMNVFKKHFQQMTYNIQLTWSMQITRTMYHTATRYLFQEEIRSKMPMAPDTYDEFARKWFGKMFAIQKGGLNWQGVRHDLYSSLRRRGYRANSLLVTEGTGRYIHLVQPEHRILAKLGKGEVAQLPVCTEGEEVTQPYQMRLYESRPYANERGLEYDTTTSYVCIPERFVMDNQDEIRGGQYDNYHTAQRNIKIFDGQRGRFVIVSLRQALDHCGLFDPTTKKVTDMGRDLLQVCMEYDPKKQEPSQQYNNYEATNYEFDREYKDQEDFDHKKEQHYNIKRLYFKQNLLRQAVDLIRELPNEIYRDFDLLASGQFTTNQLEQKDGFGGLDTGNDFFLTDEDDPFGGCWSSKSKAPTKAKPMHEVFARSNPISLDSNEMYISFPLVTGFPISQIKFDLNLDSKHKPSLTLYQQFRFQDLATSTVFHRIHAAILSYWQKVVWQPFTTFLESGNEPNSHVLALEEKKSFEKMTATLEQLKLQLPPPERKDFDAKFIRDFDTVFKHSIMLLGIYNNILRPLSYDDAEKKFGELEIYATRFFQGTQSFQLVDAIDAIKLLYTNPDVVKNPSRKLYETFNALAKLTHPPFTQGLSPTRAHDLHKFNTALQMVNLSVEEMKIVEEEVVFNEIEKVAALIFSVVDKLVSDIGSVEPLALVSKKILIVALRRLMLDNHFRKKYIERTKTPKDTLETYTEIMREWIQIESLVLNPQQKAQLQGLGLQTQTNEQSLRGSERLSKRQRQGNRSTDVVITMLANTPISYDFFELCLRYNIPVPFNFILFRMHTTFETGSAIAFPKGEETAVCLVKDADLMLGNEISSYTTVVQSVFTSGCVIRTPRTLAIQHHTFSRNYKGGAGTSLYPCTKIAQKNYISSATNFDHDIFVCLIPHTCKLTVDYTDQTGHMNNKIFNAPNDNLQYPTALIYRQVWRWCSNNTDHMFSYQGIMNFNKKSFSIAWQGSQYVWAADSKTNEINSHIPGATALGPHTGTNEFAILRGNSNEYTGRGLEGSTFAEHVLGG